MQPAYGTPVYGNTQIPIGGQINSPNPLPMGNNINAKYAVRSLDTKRIIAVITGVILVALGIYMCQSAWFWEKTYFSAIGFVPGLLLILWAIISYLTFRNKNNLSQERVNRASAYFPIVMVLGIFAILACVFLIVLTHAL